MSRNLYLAHHGVKGQKWGVLRYQNKDGSLTPLGRVHYGVGEARKKASDAVKKAPENAKNAIKSAPDKAKKAISKTIRDLQNDRRAAKVAAHKRRRQIKAERARDKERRRKEKAEDLARKIAAKKSKQTLKELKAEFDEARMSDTRRKIERLVAKQERMREKAFLREQERQLKRSMKDVKRVAKKDAREKFSNKDIKNLTDEELAARTRRLRAELDLRKLEIERDSPAASAGMKFVSDFAGRIGGAAIEAVAGSARVAMGSQIVSALKESGIDQNDINEYLRWTKKK